MIDQFRDTKFARALRQEVGACRFPCLWLRRPHTHDVARRLMLEVGGAEPPGFTKEVEPARGVLRTARRKYHQEVPTGKRMTTLQIRQEEAGARRVSRSQRGNLVSLSLFVVCLKVYSSWRCKVRSMDDVSGTWSSFSSAHQLASDVCT